MIRGFFRPNVVRSDLGFQNCATSISALGGITARLRSRIIGQALQALLIRRAGDAAFGDDRRDVAVRRHVESGIGDVDSVRREPDVVDVSDLARVALLDGNLVARGEVEVEGRDRARRRRRGCRAPWRAPPRNRCRSCSPRRRWRRCGRRRPRRSRSRPRFMKCPAMLSVISVTGMSSCISSHAVRRAPCRNGRVSSA